jgi:hypothetical protein
MLSLPRPQPHVSLIRRGIEDFVAQPVQILTTGESGIYAESLFGTTPDWLRLARQALPEWCGMAGQGTDRPFDVLVPIHGAAEPSKVRRVSLEDLGNELAPVLAKRHGWVVMVRHQDLHRTARGDFLDMQADSQKSSFVPTVGRTEAPLISKIFTQNHGESSHFSPEVTSLVQARRERWLRRNSGWSIKFREVSRRKVQTPRPDC